VKSDRETKSGLTQAKRSSGREDGSVSALRSAREKLAKNDRDRPRFAAQTVGSVPVFRYFLAASLVILALSGCGPSREVLLVYSPHGPDVLGDYEKKFEAAYPEVDVQCLDMGSQQVYERIKSERNNPQADVWWGAPSSMFIQAAEEELLAPYKPTWADEVDAAYHDPQARWYGTYLSPLAIVFNNRAHTKETVPQTWDELLEPEWNQKIALREPLPSGTMRTFICAMILRGPSPDAGIDWLKRLDEATEAYLGNPQLLYDHLKRNEDLVSVWLMADIALQRERNGYPLDTVVPPDTPVITEGIAIVEGAPHREWAETFYEFVTTAEALAHQAHAYAKVPARKDLDPATLPKWMVDQSIDAMEIDWEAFAEREGALIDRWKAEVYGAR
jgi:iron(III) transport system substrate-binding protein